VDRFREHRFEWGVLIAYAAYLLVMLPLHEPWRDEAQAWLIARDLDLIGIISQSAAEGSPALWQLVLAPFAQLGFPYVTERVVHGVFACTTVAVVLFTSPYARWQKLAFAASYLMAFEYAVIARSYVMSLMFLFSLAALDGRRHERPVVYGLLVLALANTNLHSLTIAAVLGASFAFELVHRRQGLVRWIVLAAMVAGGAFAVWQLGERTMIAFAKGGTDPVRIFAAIRTAFHPMRPAEAPYLITALIAFIALIASLWREKRAFFVFAVPILGWMLSPLSRVIHEPRHAGFIMALALFALWISWKPSPSRNEPDVEDSPSARHAFVAASRGVAGVLVFGLLAFSFLDTAAAVSADARGKFSNARAMAAHLEHASDPRPIAAFRSPPSSSLLPYLPQQRFWYVDGARWGTFVVWNRAVALDRSLSNADVVARVDDEFGDDRPLLLMSREIPEPESLGYRLRHTSTGLAAIARGDEQYFLYEPVAREP